MCGPAPTPYGDAVAIETEQGGRLDPDWLAETDAWISGRLAAHRLGGAGPVETVRVRPWSIVRRVDTDAGPYWFKAGAPGGAYEAALVGALTDWLPGRVLPALAVHPGAGWLLCPDGGPTQREACPGEPDPERWAALLRSYAELQRELAPRADDLLALGVPDARPARLPDELARLLDDPAVELPEPRRAELAALAPDYARWCAELATDGLPASLQHDDLHDGNVFVGGAGLRFFDWGDASVAHPFGCLLVALNVAGHRFGVVPGAPELARLRDAYLEPWIGVRDLAGLRRSARLALRVAKIGRALSWQRAIVGAASPGWRRTLGADLVTPAHRSSVAAWLDALTEPDLA